MILQQIHWRSLQYNWLFVFLSNSNISNRFNKTHQGKSKWNEEREREKITTRTKSLVHVCFCWRKDKGRILGSLLHFFSLSRCSCFLIQSHVVERRRVHSCQSSSLMIVNGVDSAKALGGAITMQRKIVCLRAWVRYNNDNIKEEWKEGRRRDREREKERNFFPLS